MLHINLLPPDRRQRERTPLPRFIILLIGVAIITSEVAVGAYGYMNWLDLLRQKQKHQSTKKSLQPQVETFEQLQNDIQKLKQRKQILEEIRPEGLKEKYQWSYSLDQLLTVIDQSPGVWIESLNGSMDEGEARGASASMSLQFEAKVAYPFSRITNFQQLMKKRLIQEEGVFTNLNRTWHPYQEGEEEGKIYWSTKYTLKRSSGDEN